MASPSVADQNATFQIRPDLKDKFRSSVVRDAIHNTLVEKLTGFVYNAEAAEVMSKSLTENLRDKILDLGLPRYKFVVNVVIGEQRGEGVKVGARCLWDADTDNYAADVFLAENFFCSASVFAVYFY
ncbi:dynein light chain Tctex-type protein 2B-like isoform X2 [Homarus americanus]|uniref:dynein light chain Tctex-type protein 2B-like isoform X2 n=1 Tax=Homarus americanus TaxID=6706 RepID=UPI001C44317F|nr:dynein light chain Tctex-type protein 2B-like isoform X2 [Homarus americanus]